MGATKEQAEQTRQGLLDAALIVFSKKGFNATRLEDISKEAGVTRGSFYWHFKNKTEVFCELHRHVMTEFVKKMKNAVDNSKSALQNLRNVLYNTISELICDEDVQRCGRLFYAVEYTPDVVTALAKIREEMGYPVRSLLSELINNGKKAKEIRNDLETEAVFKSSLSTLIGTADQILDGFFPVSKKDARVIVDIFIAGIKNNSKKIQTRTQKG